MGTPRTAESTFMKTLIALKKGDPQDRDRTIAQLSAALFALAEDYQETKRELYETQKKCDAMQLLLERKGCFTREALSTMVQELIQTDATWEAD